jgi:phage terminase large subunit-like protein
MGRPRKAPPPPGPVTAADVIAFIETVCLVPEGKFVGQPLKLQEWQKDILRLIYDNPAQTRRAIISLGRKNAKSTLAACLLLAHLAARRPGTGPIRSYIRPRKAAIRPVLFSRPPAR